MDQQSARAFILVGATATGKSAVAQLLAERFGSQIISADSMQVYRGMDIGTAKVTAAERGSVVYHGLDMADPDTTWSTGDWLRAVKPHLSAATPPIATGGTGLYIRALIQGLDAPAASPEARKYWDNLLQREGISALQQALLSRDPSALATLADPQNPRRLIRALEKTDSPTSSPPPPPITPTPSPHPIAVGLRLPRPVLRHRITLRATAMFESGLLTEVTSLIRTFPQLSPTAAKAIGYAEAIAHLTGQITLQEAIEKTITRTCQLAKRQETWFRHQLSVAWVDITPDDSPATLAEQVAKLWEKHGPTTLKD
ncbi:MAG: tRNA (adenosine(37)-N6)-dimethylallyltransferase MiaA [Lentisphaerae bacterium]|nr:tRNA (adenosine(37)-N6)-dimethylallyltransferase MiaA [Lentisphaerota bacterium]